MLYLEAMGNLQLGNVANYLQPIIAADYTQTTDIRFLAIFATLPTAYTRPDEVKIPAVKVMNLKFIFPTDFRDLLANILQENFAASTENCCFHNAAGVFSDPWASFGSLQRG